MKNTMRLLVFLIIPFMSFFVKGQDLSQSEERIIYSSEVDEKAIPEGGFEKFLLAVGKKLPSRQVDVRVLVTIVIDDQGVLVQDSTKIVNKSNSAKVDNGIIKAVNSTGIKWVPATIIGKGSVYSKLVFPIYYKSN